MKNNDTYAFPIKAPHPSRDNQGMTLRDYFAGQYLTGMIASPQMDRNTDKGVVAETCYRLADAMLEARKK